MYFFSLLDSVRTYHEDYICNANLAGILQRIECILGVLGDLSDIDVGAFELRYESDIY